MMKMKQILTAAILALFLFPACQSEQSNGEEGKEGQKSDKETQEKDQSTGTRYDEKAGELPHEALDAEDLLPNLEEGERLALDSVSKHHLERMNSYVSKNARKAEDLGNSAYNKLQADLANEIRQIENNSDLSGKPKEKRDQLLKHVKDQLEVLEGDDRQASQVALLNLSTIMEEFGKHFE